MKPYMLWLTLLVSLSLTGCEKLLAMGLDKKDTPAIISQEDKELLERIKAKEKARIDLETNPSQFIEPGSWERFDKGIINDYTRATSMQFTNNSQFDVSDLSGKITFLSEDGTEMATVPFRAQGEVRAGTTTKLEVTSGEISGAAHSARIVVEKIRIRG